MTDSTDDSALAEVDPRQREHVYGNPGLRFHPEASVNAEIATREQVRQDADRREKLRAAELERMDALYKRIEKGIDEGMVDLESGAKMLLNVSSARMALGGVGHVYPGAW